MIEITDRGKEEILKDLKGTDHPIRIFISCSSWAGTSFSITLDEKKEDDIIIESEGFTFLIDEYLHEEFPNFHIDFRDSFIMGGYQVIPTKAS